jgi:alkylhydroperoxidase/carboxymuconolactone decarboxylase family protein YurZ
MLPSKQKKAFVDFYNSARSNEILESKVTLMIHLASAMALSCYPWMEHYLGVARAQGVSEDEIGAVQSIVMAVSAGKINAQLLEVENRLKAAKIGHSCG